MKLHANKLLKSALFDSHGEKLGKVKDLLFDDREWKIRYLVVDTGSWLHDRHVLITPDQTKLDEAALGHDAISSTLSKVTIEGCPTLETHAPISRRYEAEMAAYYNTSPYWLGSSSVWGVGNAGALVPPSPEKQAEHDRAMQDIEQCHLRSLEEVTGYEVVASDQSKIGSVEQFEIDWPQRRIVEILAEKGGVLTRKTERTITPSDVEKIDWSTRQIFLNRSWDNDETSADREAAPGTGLPAPTF